MTLKIIGIAGVAQVGKDSFGLFLSELLGSAGLKSRREAFADCLKQELDPFLTIKANISALTENLDEKKVIRPFLVEYGRLMRNLTNGRYWIDQVNKRLEKNLKNDIITIVTDVRYPNEAQWIQSCGGEAIHLTRKGILPANPEEELNDPRTQEACNYSFNWESSPFPESLKDQATELLNESGILSKFSRRCFNHKHQASP